MHYGFDWYISLYLIIHLPYGSDLQTIFLPHVLMGRVAQLSEPPTKAAWVVEPKPMIEVSLGREKAQDAFVQTKEKQMRWWGWRGEAEVQARSNEKSKPSAPT